MQPRGRLPTQFVSEFGYQIGRRVVLHDPNGNQIEVSVKKEYGDIFFKYGPPWQHPMIDGSTKHVLFKELIFVSFFIGTNIAKYWWNYAVDFYMLFTFYFFGSSNLKIK
jgi:hypothetical protein